MKVYAINGSPRKKWNTATLLENALDGAREFADNVETELIHLYSLNYTGCTSCFQCKRIGGSSYGRCAVKDDLHPLLEKVLFADIMIIGSPIYFSDMTGMLRSFMERLLFPCFVYDKNYSSIAPKKFPTAFIYTMNVDEQNMELYHYPERLAPMENFTGRSFGFKPEILYANDTYQFPDYSKYKNELFSPEAKAQRREIQFPKDCERAKDLGRLLAKKACGAA